MIAKFETSPASAGTGTGTGKGSNTILIILGIAIAGFVVYKFVIKPAMDKKKEEQNAQ